ncbi:MAG TPA: peptidyl-alpha-hydroxyglycine alpha-amidating lyase family protein [Emcibacteraceae bacterium]|nr:peptidyl-alpha-hydroxyglycine alpha-amidating lyase family protein [Emcibacteraceae bacterium]
MRINKKIANILFASAALTSVFSTSAMAQGNPYEPIEGEWITLPDGRQWGSTSTVYYAGNGNIWVAERCGGNTNCLDTPDIDPIMLVDVDGNILKSFGKNMIVWPHGLHVDPDGNLWIADARGDEKRKKGHQVHKFSPDGKLLMSIGTAGVAGKDKYIFDQPCDVAVAANGDIFVADGHGAGGNNRIVKYNSKGEYLMEFGDTGSERGLFREPHALAISSDGRLFVGDRHNARVQIFDLEGHHIDQWTQFGRPSGIYIDKNDMMYVADSESNTGYQRNPGWQRGIRIGSANNGWVTAFIPDPNPGYARGTSVAEGVTADEAGNVYGAEVAQMRMRKYIPKTYRKTPPPPRRN